MGHYHAALLQNYFICYQSCNVAKSVLRLCHQTVKYQPYSAGMNKTNTKSSTPCNNVIPLREPAPYCVTEQDIELYSRVVNEPIVGAFGLPLNKAQISVKGDPSLRETVLLRPRQESRVDRQAGKVLSACEWLLRKTGVYAVYIGFNSNEIRTESVFNPFNHEIHDAEALISEGYLERHFVKIPYKKKMEAIQRTSSALHQGKLRKYLPKHWRHLLKEERENWVPLDKKQIAPIMVGLGKLRRIDDFYLRNAYVSLSQNLVRASFNCDGMYIVQAENFARFVEENV